MFCCGAAEPKQERDDMINPYWIEDRDLKKGEVDYISSAEAQFWKDLLEKYLHPIDENKEEKVCLSCHYCYCGVGYGTNMATSSKERYVKFAWETASLK